ncbi:kruppel-like zinc finger protein [Sesbania bispinosa]|nr:kruppel-like zinc finger protein [Sesbania bispinosa]
MDHHPLCIKEEYLTLCPVMLTPGSNGGQNRNTLQSNDEHALSSTGVGRRDGLDMAANKGSGGGGNSGFGGDEGKHDGRLDH